MAKRKPESLAETERLMEEVCEWENCKQALLEMSGGVVGEERRLSPLCRFQNPPSPEMLSW
jgi:hypothetical protein